ncbi:MAG: plasmid recombination protein [Dysgonomonas sp.]|uniref:MobV family relaxase n=1 Tax=Dysgonomonas sp. TaxID=1891233 RepID=UPI002580C708|nr:MobV family relaxase [Dysgonomonas sp.]MBS7121607.1 plasmid recombination protein [Dysgonomonas sp.]
MGYVVLHLDKSPRNEAAMTDHIERKVIAPNVDPKRTHLNKELVPFPEGVTNRTEAIKHRIANAGLSRKVGKNQVQVIRLILSGSTEDMLRIQKEGKLDYWCKDSMDWLKKEYGEKNIVAATLHLDEDAPHIHASVVPIVQGERRKKKSNKEPEIPKKQYKKKNTNRPRLCADDVMTKEKLIHYQDSYAEAMDKYGLDRGIKGSEARHISTSEHFRNQKEESNNLQINIGLLLMQEESKRKSIEQLNWKEQEAKQDYEQAEKQKQQKEAELLQTEQVLSKTKGELKTEKLKNTAADVGSTIMDGISSMIGSSKVKRQQQEIENLKEEKQNLIQEVKTLKQNMQTMQKEHETAYDKLKQELLKIYDLFPKIKELLWIERLLQAMKFTENLIKKILDMNPVVFKGDVYSPEYKRYFETERSVVEIKLHPEKPDKYELTIDGVDDTNWCRKKYKESLESLGIKLNEPKKNQGQRR